MDCHPSWGLFHGEHLVGIYKSNLLDCGQAIFYAAPVTAVPRLSARVVVLPVGDSKVATMSFFLSSLDHYGGFGAGVLWRISFWLSLPTALGFRPSRCTCAQGPQGLHPPDFTTMKEAPQLRSSILRTIPC